MRSIDWFGTDPDDAALLAAVVRGDGITGAMALLYARHVDAVRKVCNSQLRSDRDSVEDVVQDVFVLLQRHAGTITNTQEMRRWLRRTAINACRNHRKRARHDREVAVADAPDRPGETGDFTDVLGHVDQVGQLLARMPAKPAALLAAHYLRGMTMAEIAEWLGSTAASIKTQMHQARRDARRLVEAGRAMVPLPLLEWIGRLEQSLKTAGVPAIAAAVSSVIAVGVLVPSFTNPDAEAADGPGDRRTSVQEAASQAVTVIEASESIVPVNQTTGPASPTVTSGVGGSTPAAGMHVQPEPAPLHTVDVPAVGPVNTGYERPDRPADDQMTVGTEQTGEVARVDSRDEPTDGPLFATTCAATAATGAVACEP